MAEGFCYTKRWSQQVPVLPRLQPCPFSSRQDEDKNRHGPETPNGCRSDGGCSPTPVLLSCSTLLWFTQSQLTPEVQNIWSPPASAQSNSCLRPSLYLQSHPTQKINRVQRHWPTHLLKCCDVGMYLPNRYNIWARTQLCSHQPSLNLASVSSVFLSL